MSKLIIYAFISIFTLVNSQGGICPEGWTKFKDEKCFLLVESFTNFEDAQLNCKEKGSLLATVKDEEQQTFLQSYVFDTSEVETQVWIGATRKSATEFEWDDGTPMEYENWDVDHPTEINGRDCASMQSKFSKFSSKDIEGTWKDMSCKSAFYFICERVPTWSLDDIRKVLIETRKLLIETREKLDGHVNQPVPVGFIYTQYPGQPLPSTIWPAVGWAEVTSQYAGRFFRAVGGNSAEFGVNQDASYSRLTHLDNQVVNDRQFGIQVPISGWSQPIFSGNADTNSGTRRGLRFHTENLENRPINTAIRIWIRET